MFKCEKKKKKEHRKAVNQICIFKGACGQIQGNNDENYCDIIHGNKMAVRQGPKLFVP